MSHTPGPWRTTGIYPEHAAHEAIAVDGPEAIAHVLPITPGPHHRDSIAETKANAFLIAAAPELLAVAKGCLGYFEYMQAQQSEFTPDEAWLAPLRAAIAKAEGR